MLFVKKTSENKLYKKKCSLKQNYSEGNPINANLSLNFGALLLYDLNESEFNIFRTKLFYMIAH